MHARTLDMFHDARDEHMLAIRDRIDLTLFADDVLVDQDRRVM